MEEQKVPDLYSDQFQINIGAYGASLNFAISNASPTAPGVPPQADRVATIRMSLEHLKLMTYIMHAQILAFEKQVDVSIPMPAQVLTSLRIGQEDWQAFWTS